MFHAKHAKIVREARKVFLVSFLWLIAGKNKLPAKHAKVVREAGKVFLGV